MEDNTKFQIFGMYCGVESYLMESCVANIPALSYHVYLIVILNGCIPFEIMAVYNI